MNRFDEIYKIKRASAEDSNDIMCFIADVWGKKNHILATSKDFFLYEFGDGEHLNFVIAKQKQSGRIDAIVGYYPSSDPATSGKDSFDIWGGMWATRSDASLPLLGVEIVRRLKEIVGYRYHLGVGINSKTAMPLLRDVLGKHCFTLRHYYMLSEREEYKIAKIAKKTPPVVGDSGLDTPSGARLVQAINIEGIAKTISHAAKHSVPSKDVWYINKRFFQHPIYKYIIWEIISPSDKGVLVGREVKACGAKILRIVDFLGNVELLDGLRGELQTMMRKNDYEYIDFYIYGIDDEYLKRAGFTQNDAQSGNIIPNHFEPFEQKNVVIHGVSDVLGARCCKADADQDRPNSIYYDGN